MSAVRKREHLAVVEYVSDLYVLTLTFVSRAPRRSALRLTFDRVARRKGRIGASRRREARGRRRLSSGVTAARTAWPLAAGGQVFRVTSIFSRQCQLDAMRVDSLGCRM